MCSAGLLKWWSEALAKKTLGESDSHRVLTVGSMFCQFNFTLLLMLC